MTRVIEVEHLQKRYGDAGVIDVSLEVAEGEILGILGPNGAGKTTTVECLQGLRDRDGGTVRVLGLDPQRQGRELRRRVGSQLQESALPDRVKVWEALDLFSSLAGDGVAWETLMEQWGLADKAGTSFARLSGGQRQRLFVALALVNNPEVVFLDEMTQGLDPAARRVAWDLIEEIRDRGTTVVLVTHYLDEAEQLCDRLLVVDEGHVVASGTAGELIARHGDHATVRFSTDEPDVSWLADVDPVDRVSRHGREIAVEGTGPVLALVASTLVAKGIVPDDLRVDRTTLEDVYLKLTGRQDGGR
jgi:ABC-2 type transport system ATP-binding protein